MDKKSMIEEEILPAEEKELQVPMFGYELIREIVLEDILGKDSPQILYWSGKQLARRFPLNDRNELASFFESAGWGTLEFIKEKKEEVEYSLGGTVVQRRFELFDNNHFQLEAGFLAEQYKLLMKCNAEAAVEVKNRSQKAVITIKWDTSDPVS